MSTPQFLDANGLAKYHKEVVDRKVDRIVGKGLSTNDLTNRLKNNYDAAFTHSLIPHAPADAEKNQNAFAEINVGQINLGAESPADILRLKGEGNIAVTITDTSSHKYITFSTTGLSAVATSGSYEDLTNKPTIPTTAADIGALPSSTAIPSKLSDLAADDSHQTVTAAEKTKWNGMAVGNLPAFPSDASVEYEYSLRARIMPGDTTPTYYWEAVRSILPTPVIYIEEN